MEVEKVMKRRTAYNKQSIKRSLIKFSKLVLVFMIYDLGTLMYSILVTIWIWLGMEMSFAYIAAVLVPKLYPLTNEQEALIFGVLHGILVFFTVLAYYFVMHQLEELETVLSKSRLVYTLHSPQWEHVYIAVLSTAISFYFLSIVILIAYAMNPEKFKESVLLDQALLSLLIIIYIPIVLILWKYTKITVYLRRAERQEKILLSEDIQQNN